MPDPMPTLKLKPGREKAMLRRHPWIFSGAVAAISDSIEPGETVEVVSSRGDFLGWGALSPQSQIRVRVWSWDRGEIVNREFFKNRIAAAAALREGLLPDQVSNAYRLIHGESDGLPGIVVDRYGDVLVLQSLSAGAEYWKEIITDALVEVTGVPRVFERSDLEVRSLEGLERRVGPLYGGEPPDLITIWENGLEYLVDIRSGQKTGFYLDQRENRKTVRSYCQGREVLDCFSYSGGFTLNALRGGARSVEAVDISRDALALVQSNLAQNDLPEDRVSLREGDVFQELRRYRDKRRSFDMVILDPPKFAATRSQVSRAARGYKDINLLALKLLRPGGLLTTFSCSGGLDADLFQKIVAGAALDAGREAQIIDRLDQAADHPVALNFPEGSYLKGLVVWVK
jgi:23S rRNA (cytosine1962-C5)-methyltransferase